MKPTALTKRPIDRVSVGSESQDSKELLSRFVYTLSRWWILAIPLGLLFAAAAGSAVFFTFKPEYQASMWLRIHTRAPYIVFEDNEGSAQFVKNQSQLLRSRVVLGPLLSDPVISRMEEIATREDKVGEMSKRLTVNSVGQSEFFSVQYRGYDQNSSKRVVEQVVDSYLALQNNRGARQRQEVISLLEGEKAIRQRKVEELRQSLEKTAKESSVEERTPSKDELTTLAELRKRSTILDVESAILKIEIETLSRYQTKKNQKPSSQEVTQFVEGHPDVRKLLEEMEGLEDKLRQYSSYGSKHPYTKQIRRDLDVRRPRLVRLKKKLRTQFLDSAQRTVQTNQSSELESMKSRLASYQITRDVIQSHVDAETDSVRKSTGDQLQVEFLRGELDQASDVHDMISRRLLVLKTEQRAPQRVQVIDANGAVSVPMEITPYKKMGLASTAAFAVPLSLFFLLELYWKRVSSVRNLEEGSQLNVIGEIASLPRTPLLGFIGRRRYLFESQLYRESVDHLRACVTLQDSMRTAQVFAVASAVSREGKTSLASQFASSLNASTTKPVLLIDGDMRCPSLHRLKEADLSPGLAEVLGGRASWNESVVHLKDTDLYLLNAGNLFEAPSSLFGNRRFEHLMRRLRRKFRYIVIDTPPVLAASEAISMAKSADAFLLCTMLDHSRMHQVQLAYQQLCLAGGNCIGTVVNGVPVSKYLYRYALYPYVANNQPVIDRNTEEEIEEQDNEEQVAVLA